MEITTAAAANTDTHDSQDQKLIVTITGQSAAGRSSLALALSDMLDDLGLNVSVFIPRTTDDDAVFSETITQHAENKLRLLAKAGVSVVIVSVGSK